MDDVEFPRTHKSEAKEDEEAKQRIVCLDLDDDRTVFGTAVLDAVPLP